jgi:hypothetical protein
MRVSSAVFFFIAKPVSTHVWGGIGQWLGSVYFRLLDE